MPTKVTTRKGDCLCVIAIQNGFYNCQPLRDEPKNAAFLKRPLRDGDVVTVPDVRNNQVGRGTDQKHSFVKKTAPPVSIRFVRGSASANYSDDADTLVLNVSNYPTDKAGANANVDLFKDFGFDKDADADPDAFKVEVIDPAAGGGPITVTLDPRMPVYKLEDNKLKVAHHDQPPSKQSWFVQCASGPSAPAFRSKYLRLVTHDADANSVPEQAILVGDLSDGKGTGKASDPDNVEILDFEIRATYTIPRCPASTKCQVSVSRPVGDAAEKHRFRVAFHIFKRRATGQPVGNLTVQRVKHRALRDLRGFYAQASMAPKLVSADGSDNGPSVVFMAEPDNNMVIVGDSTGQGASGHNKHKQPSTLTITDVSMGTIATVTFREKLKPFQVAAAIENALDPLTFRVDTYKNPRPLSGKHNSYDMLITRLDGGTVDLTVNSDDTTLHNNVTIARVDISNIHAGDMQELRRVFRCSPGPAGVMNVYGINQIAVNPDDPFSHALAFSIPISYKTNTEGTQAREMGDAILSEANWLSDGNSYFNVLPHECGHVLGKVTHVDKNDPHQPDEMMNAIARPITDDGPNPMRISDYPVLVNYELHEDATRLINAVNRMTTSRPDLLESW